MSFEKGAKPRPDGKIAMPTCVRLVIHGRVQGVGYRAWLADEACRRALSGWVRNRHDGTVEALIQGSDIELSEMIGTCRRGPIAARVSNVEIMPMENDEVPEGAFAILPTV